MPKDIVIIVTIINIFVKIVVKVVVKIVVEIVVKIFNSIEIASPSASVVSIFDISDSSSYHLKHIEHDFAKRAY